LSYRAPRGSRQRFVRASMALGVLGVAVLAAIPTFGTRSRHHGIGECSYEVVSRAPIWMWAVGVMGLALGNAALLFARVPACMTLRQTEFWPGYSGSLSWSQWFGSSGRSWAITKSRVSTDGAEASVPIAERVDTGEEYVSLDEVAKDRVPA
jgi:hypothetical protein